MKQVYWKVLGALFLVMMFSGIGYKLQTRYLPTPFMDSITVAQKALKQVTIGQRKRAYMISLAVSVALVWWLWHDEEKINYFREKK